jgi:raffinose/stachyose/melibiose transport system substrate-binding protein
VCGQDRHWAAELKAGTVSFDGSPGWRQALQEFIDLNNTGCFQPGATGTTQASAETQFAQGQGLMLPGYSSHKGAIDAASPQFGYSFSPFPGGAGPNQTMTFLHPGNSLSVNAHSSAQNQAAAEAFVDFIARPKQNALYTQVTGGQPTTNTSSTRLWAGGTRTSTSRSSKTRSG